MAWYNDLFKAGIGFLGGGPAGAAASIAGSLLAPSQDPYAQAAAGVPAGTPMMGSLQTALAQQAFLRGFQEAANNAPQAYSEKRAIAGGGGSTRSAQASGGQMGVPYGAQGLGGGSGAGGGGSQQSTYGQGTSELDDMYRRTLQTAMSGQSTLPQGAYQGAVSRGQTALNQQALLARQGLSANLAQRGMSNSGAMSQGLAGIEQGRLSGLSNLYGGLEEQNLALTPT